MSTVLTARKRFREGQAVLPEEFMDFALELICIGPKNSIEKMIVGRSHLLQT